MTDSGAPALGGSEPSGRAAPRLERIALAVALLTLALLLFLQPGNLFDEPEHLHVAWLMAVRGLHPIDDFFEHHTPLLWELLGLLYRAGFKGPEVLYGGRALVLLFAGAWCWSLARVQQRLSGSDGFGAWFSLGLFALLAAVASELVVVRPETLALSLSGLAAWAICSGMPEAPRALLAGALAMLASLASPRFALLQPALLLLAKPGELRFSLRRLALLTLGGAAALAACLATILPPRDLLFDLDFSALLQKVGIVQALDLRYLAVCFGAALGAPMAALAFRARVRRGELALWALHGAAMWTICWSTCGLYPYSQAFAPALFWPCLFLAWIESHPPAPGSEALRRPLNAGGMFAICGLLMVLLTNDSSSMYSMTSMTRSRRVLLDALRPGATEMISAIYSPITIDDSSYFAARGLDSDSPGHLCVAVNVYVESHPGQTRVPRCSLLAEFRQHPPDITYNLAYLSALPEEEIALRELIAANYQETERVDDAPNLSFASKVLFRK